MCVAGGRREREGEGRNKINVSKCYKLVNLGKGFIDILCITPMTFLSIWRNKNVLSEGMKCRGMKRLLMHFTSLYCFTS